MFSLNESARHTPDTLKSPIGLLRAAFAGRSVFVTGHTGFKGSWLCPWLKQLGAQVTGYSLEPPTNPNLFTINHVKSCVDRHYEADLRDETSLLAAIREARPDAIIHLAAQSIVRYGFQHPRETFDVNVMGTVSVLECVRKLGQPCSVLVVSSDKCYENREQVWGYRECDPMGEHDPYGASKGAAELVVRAYRDSYFPTPRLREHGVKLASARAGNVIGGGDFTPDALMVDAMHAIHSGQPIRIRNPRALRPWQHVLQALNGYLTLTAKMLVSDEAALCSGWNFGPRPGNEISVRDVVELLIQEWGAGTWVDASDPKQPAESCILRLAIDKALWQLGWQPNWDILTSLRHTVRWYRDYFNGSKSLPELGLAQIEAYEQSTGQAHVGTSPTRNLQVALTTPSSAMSGLATS